MRFLGPRQYGLWLVVVAAAPLLSMSGFGLMAEAGNQLAAAFAARAERRIRSIASTSFVGYLLLGIAGAAVVIPPIWFFALQSRSDIRFLAAETATIFVIGLLISLPMKTFQVLVRAAKRVDVEQSAGGVVYVLKVALVLALLPLGMRLRGLAAIQAVCLVAPGLLCWWYLRRRWGLRVPRLADASIDTARPMLRPGGYFFLLQAAGAVCFGIDSWVIGQRLGPAAVTPYGIGFQAVIAVDLVWWLGLSALAPYVTVWHVAGQWERLAFGYGTAVRLGIGYAGAAVAFLAVAGRTILVGWAGPVAFPGSGTWDWMLVFLACQVILSPADVLLTATSRHEGYAKMLALEAALNLGLSIWWVRLWGIPGVIAGTVVARLLTNAWFMPCVAARLLAIGTQGTGRVLRIFGGGAAGAGLAVLALLCAPRLGGSEVAAGALAACAFVAAYGALALSPSDRRQLVSAGSAALRGLRPRVSGAGV